MCPTAPSRSTRDRTGRSAPGAGKDGDLDVGHAGVHQRANGRTTVPQVFIDDRHIGGSDDLAALDRRGGLDPLLA